MDLKPCPISGRPIVCPVKIKNDPDQTVYCFLSIALWFNETGLHPLNGSKKQDTFDYTVDDLVHDSISQDTYNKSIYKNSPTKRVDRDKNQWLTENQKYYLRKIDQIDQFYKEYIKVHEAKSSKKSLGWIEKIKSMVLKNPKPLQATINITPSFYEKAKTYFTYKHFYYQAINYQDKCNIWGTFNILNGICLTLFSYAAYFIFEAFVVEILHMILIISACFFIYGLLVLAYPNCINRIGLLNALLDNDEVHKFYRTVETTQKELDLSITENALDARANTNHAHLVSNSNELKLAQERTNIYSASIKEFQKFLANDYTRVTQSVELKERGPLESKAFPGVFFKKNMLIKPLTAILWIADKLLGNIVNLETYGNYTAKNAKVFNQLTTKIKLKKHKDQSSKNIPKFTPRGKL